MEADTSVAHGETTHDQFFIQLVCAVGGLVLIFHPLLFIGNRAMLQILEHNEFYPQWPRNYFYLPVIAGLLFLSVAALRDYKRGLSGVLAVHAVMAGGVYALMVCSLAVEQILASRARQFAPGVGSWTLLLLSFVPVLVAGVLASHDAREFEPLLATWLRTAAGACVLMLFITLFTHEFISDTGTPKGFLRAMIFGVIYSAFYVFAAIHRRNGRPFAIGTGVGYPLAIVPLLALVLALSRLSGPLRLDAHEPILLLIAANIILWVVAVAASIAIRPRRPGAVLAGFVVSLGAPVLVLLLLLSLR